MNVFRSTDFTFHSLSSVDQWVADPTLAYAVAGASTFIQKASLSTYLVTNSIALHAAVGGNPYSAHSPVFDGTDWWFLERTFGSDPAYISRADFTGGTITTRITQSTIFDTQALAIAIIGSSLYAIGIFSGSWMLYQYSLTGTLTSTFTLSSPLSLVGGAVRVINANNCFWVANETGTVYKINTSGTVTTIVTGMSVCYNIFPDSSNTNLCVFGPAGPSSWGTIPLSGSSFTLVGSSINSFPSNPNLGIGVPFYDLDSNNWLATAALSASNISRANKTYGINDVNTVYAGSYLTQVIQPSLGNYKLLFPGGFLTFAFSTDNNPITYTSSWQQTSSTTVESGAYSSSIHNFQFTSVFGDKIKFTVDSTVDPSAVYSGFTGSAVPLLAILDSNEQVITSISAKTLSFTTPSSGSYTVRFQLDPLHPRSTGTFKLGYAFDIPVASFTWSPNPQLAGSLVTFTDTSTGSPTSWLWDFGDSTTSTLQNPTHTYATAGPFTVNLTATNAAGSGSTSNSVPITGILTITPMTLPDSCNTYPYPTQTVAYTGGIGPYSWSSAGSTLPSGLTFNTSTLQLLGTPVAPLSVDFYAANLHLNVISADFQTDTVDFPFHIDMLPIFATTTLPDGTLAVPYSQNVSVSGAAPIDIVSWTITSGALPTSLSISPTDTGAGETTISGTPTVAGSFTFTVRATDTEGCYQEQPLTITINATSLAITTASLLGSCLGATYSQTLTGTGGAPAYTWTISAGSLPPNLSLDASTGDITGTVLGSDLVQTYNFTVTITDIVLTTTSKPLSIVVYPNPTWVVTTLPPGNETIAYSQSVSATNGLTYALQSGSLPAGLTIASDGLITGTPTVVGGYSFTIRATSVNGCISDGVITLVIGEMPPVISGTFTNVCNNVKYYNSLTIVGGTPPWNFIVSSGALPQQLVLNPLSGGITGITAESGTFNFDITLTDFYGLSNTQSFSFDVYDSPVITVSNIPPGVQGKPFDYTFTATGGSQPKFWMLATPLPAGLIFNSIYGSISGTPTVSGYFPVTVSVQDGNLCSDALGGGSSIGGGGGPGGPGGGGGGPQIIIAGPPKIDTSSLTMSPGCAGQPYSASIIVTGGVPPYYWFITSDNFPPQNLVLNPYTGILSGIPLIAGTYPFTVKVVDQNNLVVNQDYSLIIRTTQQCGQPDEGTTVTVTVGRLPSIESDPVFVVDPFHQKYLSTYLPVPFITDK